MPLLDALTLEVGMALSVPPGWARDVCASGAGADPWRRPRYPCHLSSCTSLANERDARQHYLLFYSFVDGMAERRGPHRKAHLVHLEAAVARGELVLAGALADPLDGAVFLFQGASPAAAEALAQTDPYVVNGLVTRWHVRAWSTVVGRDAATPVASSSLS